MMQQHADAKNTVAMSSPTAVESTNSSLAFLSHIKKLLDNLEQCSFLFTKAKVPCMHMCIWAVTSILKIFENRPELFIQISGGPPPPNSDSDSQDDDSRSYQENENSKENADLEMQDDQGLAQDHAPGSQQNNNLGFADHPINEEAESDSDGDNVDSQSEDEEDEEGEENMEDS